MRRSLSLSLPLAVATAVLLAGCAAAAPTQPDADHVPDTAPVATPTPTPTAEPDPTYGDRVINERGNLVKEVGQLAGISLSDDADVAIVQFAVTDLVVDVPCTREFAEPAKNGHYVGIHLSVETTPALAQEDVPSISFSEWAWIAFDAAGKRVNDPLGNAWWCLDTGDQLPPDIGPAQSVSGWVVLDLPTDTGAVVLTHGTTTGWEWAY